MSEEEEKEIDEVSVDDEDEADVDADTEADADPDVDPDVDPELDGEMDVEPDADGDDVSVTLDDDEGDEDNEIAKTGVNIDKIDMDVDEQVDEDDLEDYDYDEADTLMKFDEELKNNYIEEYHPEEIYINYDEVKALSNITRDRDGIIVDELHKSLPLLTKYEYTNILGIRAKQINEGAKPFVNMDKEIMDGYLIAQIEIKQKKLPFIIKRPIPNGGTEYWRLSDLEILI